MFNVDKTVVIATGLVGGAAVLATAGIRKLKNTKIGNKFKKSDKDVVYVKAEIIG